MGLPGTIDSSVYHGLREVLNRHPKLLTVEFEPDSISKEFIEMQGGYPHLKVREETDDH